MTTESILVKQLEDISECPICTELYKDPRVLPCVHTYCLKCIDGWCKDKRPGDEVACPLCRSKFTVPEDGVCSLPKNFFIEKLRNLRSLSSSSSETLCDLCEPEEGEEEDFQRQPANVFCFECQQNLCTKCEKYHKKLKASRSHEAVRLGQDLKPEEMSSKYPPAECDKHKGKNLEIYCCECKTTICMMCYISTHNSHTCSDVNEIDKEFRQQMEEDISRMSTGSTKLSDFITTLDKETGDYINQISKAEKEICEKAEELKLMIEKHKISQIEELKQAKDSRLKEITVLKEDIDRRLIGLETFARYTGEMMKKGTSCDIVQGAGVLHHRVEELLTFDVIEQAVDDLGQVTIEFKSSSLMTDDSANTIGQVITNKTCKDKVIKTSGPTLSHVVLVPAGKTVRGVTSLGNDVFVVRDNVTGVEVYNTTTLILQRCIDVPGLGSYPWGLASCETNNCLYVSDCNNNVVHRVDLSGDKAVIKWKVGESPRGLSVNGVHNVLVTRYGENQLQEYTTLGKLVRAINLSNVARPWHAVQLSSGQFVVSRRTSPGVNLVDQSGRIVQSVKQVDGNTIASFSGGIILCVTKSGMVLVVDSCGNRILSINLNSFDNAQQLPLPVDGRLKAPCSLHLDESRDRLYVGEYDSSGNGLGRILVFENILQKIATS